jgi:hypothetical protein
MELELNLYEDENSSCYYELRRLKIGFYQFAWTTDVKECY